MLLPKISVITPSFNQGQFLEQTIQSVLGQAYPNLEYIIIDGGSIDESVDIIKKYEKQIVYWVSEKDKGQADAINKGFNIATGDILCWLNSDDCYLPYTLNFVASQLNTQKEAILFGNTFHFEENSPKAWGSNVVAEFEGTNLKYKDFIIQPSSFWTRKTWEKAGELDTDFNYVFDWEWFLRAAACDVKFTAVNRYMSIYRIHESHKSGTGGAKREKEVLRLYQKIHNDETYKIIEKIVLNKSKIFDLKKALYRYKLGFAHRIVMQKRFPAIYSGDKYDMTEQILHMI
jgi:glycosyltransferase involved in cell wall biosynthesis